VADARGVVDKDVVVGRDEFGRNGRGVKVGHSVEDDRVKYRIDRRHSGEGASVMKHFQEEGRN
jgi:hypothetical protein